MFDIKLYNDDFFSWHKKYADAYSLETGRRLFQHYKPESVVDWGCGIGSYLLAAKNCGIKILQGFEIGGEYARKYTDPEIQPYIKFDTDITGIFTPSILDMALCIEVAEHIEPSGSEQLVKNICKSVRKIVVFTAAPEGQDGCGHINGKPKEYWKELFNKYDFKYNPVETETVLVLWNSAPWYIKQNLLVFTHE